MSILPVTGAYVNFEAHIRAVVDEIVTFWRRKQKVDVEFAFKLGDIFVHEDLYEGPGKTMIEKRLGEGVYKTLRNYAWVAKRWPKEKRDMSKNWSWFKSHKPDGTPIVKREKPMKEASWIKTDGDGDWFVGVMRGENEEWIRVPKDVIKEGLDIDT